MVNVVEIRNGEMVVVERRPSPKTSVPRWKSPDEKKEYNYSKVIFARPQAGGGFILLDQNRPLQRFLREGNNGSFQNSSRNATTFDTRTTF